MRLLKHLWISPCLFVIAAIAACSETESPTPPVIMLDGSAPSDASIPDASTPDDASTEPDVSIPDDASDDAPSTNPICTGTIPNMGTTCGVSCRSGNLAKCAAPIWTAHGECDPPAYTEIELLSGKLILKTQGPPGFSPFTFPFHIGTPNIAGDFTFQVSYRDLVGNGLAEDAAFGVYVRYASNPGDPPTKQMWGGARSFLGNVSYWAFKEGNGGGGKLEGADGLIEITRTGDLLTIQSSAVGGFMYYGQSDGVTGLVEIGFGLQRSSESVAETGLLSVTVLNIVGTGGAAGLTDAITCDAID